MSPAAATKTLSLPLLWAGALIILAIAAASASAFPYDRTDVTTSAATASTGEEAASGITKRQLVEPVRPAKFQSIQELEQYMAQLEAYIQLLTRQRFGKRSGRHSMSWRGALGTGEAAPPSVMAALQVIDDKLNLLLSAMSDAAAAAESDV